MAEDYIGLRERLFKYLKEKHIKYAHLERMADLSNGFVRSTKGAISAPILAKILHALPDLDANWLLTGEGEMYKPQGKVEVISYGEHANIANRGHIYNQLKSKFDVEEDTLEINILDCDLEEYPQAVQNIIKKARSWHEELSQTKKSHDKLLNEHEQIVSDFRDQSEELRAIRKEKDDYQKELLDLYRRKANE